MKVPLPMFTAPSYGDRTLNEVQRCVNLFPEKTTQGYKLISTPGLVLRGTVANNTPSRGTHYTTTGRCFSVHDNDLYEVSTTFPETDRGDLNTSSGNVRFCDNGTYMLIVDGTDGYVYNLGTDSLTTIADGNFPDGPIWCCFKDGYFFVVDAGTNTFYLSQLNDPSDWTPVTAATAESSGDALVACVPAGNEVWMIGAGTSEPWYNTGNADFPFERITGGIRKIGAGAFGASALSIASHQDAIYMVATGDGILPSVWELSINGLRKLSTPYIDAALEGGTSSAFIYQHDGHLLYQLNATSTSWVYDITEGAWHERDSNFSGVYSTNRLISAVNRDNLPALGFDRTNGNVYTLAGTTNTENSIDIRRRRAFGPVEAGALLMFHHRIRFVLEVDHDSDASYTLEASLDWSDDGGATWSTARTLSKAITSGTTGQRVMMEANRLGSSRQRYYRITFTGPAARIVLQSAELDMDVGSN